MNTINLAPTSPAKLAHKRGELRMNGIGDNLRRTSND